MSLSRSWRRKVAAGSALVILIATVHCLHAIVELPHSIATCLLLLLLLPLLPVSLPPPEHAYVHARGADDWQPFLADIQCLDSWSRVCMV